MMQSDEYLHGMQRKVGWFVLVGLGALVVILLVAGFRSNFFAKKFYVYVEPPTATAFFEGLPVTFQGFGIGYVDKIELLGSAQVQVRLQLLERYRSMLHEGAIAQLGKEGMIGEQFLSLTAGDSSRPSIEPLSVLQYQSEASIEQLLNDLKPTIVLLDTLLKEAGILVSWLNDPYGDVHLAMGSLREFSGGLSSNDMEAMGTELTQMMTHIAKIVSDIDKESMVANFSHALDSTGQTLDEVKPFAHDLGENGGKSLAKLDKLLLKMQVLADSLNAVGSDASELMPMLPGLAREFKDTLSESRVLMNTLEQSWLLGGSGTKSSSPENSYLVTPPAVDLRP